MPDDWFDHRPLSDAPITAAPARLQLEPLRIEHADEFCAAAAADAEVFAHLSYPAPETPAEAAAAIERLLAPDDQLAYLQRVVSTGEVVGTTSFYDLNPGYRSLAIGHTWIGRPWWRSWVNSTSKLIMLSRAFDGLGAERVVWHTDIANTRSQQAIERLGASREGVLRHHRPRRDGSWRDTVQFSMLGAEWPAARRQLLDRAVRTEAAADAH